MNSVELFLKLLRFQSVTPDDDGAFDFIHSYLGEDWKVISVDQEGVKNRFFYKRFTHTDQHLCFAGHIDVVPPGEGWKNDPFNPIIEEDGTITARGAQDMKSGDAAFLYACKHAKAFDGTLSILLTSDEEGEGTYGTIKMLEHLRSIELLPDYAIVAEPTSEQTLGDAIKIGRRGSINGYLTIKGRQGHAAYPEKGINPIHQISQVLPQIAGHCFDQGDDYFSASQLIVTDIRSGMQVTNVTPNDLNLMFNVRNSTLTDQETIRHYLEECLGSLDYTLRLTQGSYPFVTDKNSKVVKAMERSIQTVLGIQTKHSTAGGTSDARYFGSFGIESIEFGVVNDTIHAINERTNVRQIEGLTEVFSHIIDSF